MPLPSRGHSPGPVFITDASTPRHLPRAIADLVGGIAQWRLSWALAMLDLRNRYRGSGLGPLWLTLATGVTVAGLGLVYSRLFQLPPEQYVPFLAVSLIVWGVIAQTVNESCVSLIGAEPIIRQVPLPFTVHVLRCVFRNLLVAAHNLPLILVVLVWAGIMPGIQGLLAFAGLFLILVNAFFASLLLGMVCARFRDIPPIVGNVLQLVFFMSPIIWKPELLREAARWLPLNPFYAVMETVRGPILGTAVPAGIWASAIGFTLMLAILAFAMFVRFRRRIAFWV